MHAQLKLTRQQILAFRRRVGGLEERSPPGPESLQRAAWAGLQDSMPRAALLSLHARVDGVEPSTWDDPSLMQLWGPRYNTYVVAKRDFALFSLGRLPDTEKGRRRAEETGCPRQCAPRRPEADGPRGRRRARHRQLDQVRRDDGHRRDPLGRRPRADRLDRRRRRHRPGRRLPRACSALPPHLRAGDCARVRALGGDLAARGCRRVRLARGIARGGPLAARRRVAAGGRRAGDARPARRPTPPRACCRAGMRTSCSTGRSASCSSRPRSSAGSSGPRGSGRGRSSSTARSAAPGGAPTRSCGSAPGRSSRAAARDAVEAEARSLPAPRSRAGDRRRLGGVTETNICSIVSSWPSSTARSRAAPR